MRHEGAAQLLCAPAGINPLEHIEHRPLSLRSGSGCALLLSHGRFLGRPRLSLDRSGAQLFKGWLSAAQLSQLTAELVGEELAELPIYARCWCSAICAKIMSNCGAAEPRASALPFRRGWPAGAAT